MFVFDTDVLSHVLMPTRYANLLARMATVPRNRQYTTTITVAEMTFGAHRSSRRDYLLRQFQDRLWPNLGILPFDFAAAETYGELRAELERAGTPLAVPDL